MLHVIDKSGSVTVTEDILVDFGSQQRHGFFRDMPVEYADEDDFNRLIDIGRVSVDDGEALGIQKTGFRNRSAKRSRLWLRTVTGRADFSELDITTGWQ